MRLVFLGAALVAASACSTSVRLAPEPDEPTDPCAGVECGQGTHCVEGGCVPDDVVDPCTGLRCDEQGLICVDGRCVPENDPCATARCDEQGLICVDGACVPPDDPCANIDCGPGEVCANGNCVNAQVDEDGDGFAQPFDCDDLDPGVFPGAQIPCATECGDGFQACGADAQWSECSAPVQCECRPGEERLEPCGICGLGTRICDENGTWPREPPRCEGERECLPGVYFPRCEDGCGLQRQVCNDECHWENPSPCFAIRDCLPSDSYRASCGFCGEMTVSCTAMCLWDEGGLCEGEAECPAGASETEACGLCGTRLKTCREDCHWEYTGDCEGEPADAECAAGDMETGDSCGCLDQSWVETRTCDAATCTWGTWEGCPRCTCFVDEGLELCPTEAIVLPLCPDGTDQTFNCGGGDGLCAMAVSECLPAVD